MCVSRSTQYKLVCNSKNKADHTVKCVRITYVLTYIHTYKHTFIHIFFYFACSYTTRSLTSFSLSPLGTLPTLTRSNRHTNTHTHTNIQPRIRERALFTHAKCAFIEATRRHKQKKQQAKQQQIVSFLCVCFYCVYIREDAFN